MKCSRVWVALSIATVVSTSSLAQTKEDLQRQLSELKSSWDSKVQDLEAENAALKARRAAAQKEPGLETEINRLSERMAAGTNLRSCASVVKLGGEFRYRAAYLARDDGVAGTIGGPGPNGGEGFYGDGRVRLNFQYDFGCDMTAFAELQSHFAFGEDANGPIDEWDGNDTVGDVGMYQAWFEFRNIIGRPDFSARIGRQEVILGNQFQFGNADWYNGVVHDGLRVDWRSDAWGFTLLAVKLDSTDGDQNQLWSYFNDHDNDELYSAYVSITGCRDLVLDGYWIYINGHGNLALNSGANFGRGFLYPFSPNAYYHTFGARLGGNMNVFCGLDWNVEGAIQTGENAGIDVDGATVEAELGMTVGRNNRFRVFARGLWAEGADDESTGYLINYPNRHSNTGFRARYGIADMIPMTNVVTAQLGFHFDPACNFTLGATGLWAITEQDVGFGGLDDELGTELDVWAEYRHSERVTLGAGVAVVWAGESGEFIWGVSDEAQFVGYLQARLLF